MVRNGLFGKKLSIKITFPHHQKTFRRIGLYFIKFSWRETCKFFICFRKMLVIVISSVDGNSKPIFFRKFIFQPESKVKLDDTQKCPRTDSDLLFKNTIELPVT